MRARGRRLRGRVRRGGEKDAGAAASRMRARGRAGCGRGGKSIAGPPAAGASPNSTDWDALRRSGLGHALGRHRPRARSALPAVAGRGRGRWVALASCGRGPSTRCGLAPGAEAGREISVAREQKPAARSPSLERVPAAKSPSRVWEKKGKMGNREIMALKEGWPPYMEEMDIMFNKTAADGSTSYCPGSGQSRHTTSSPGTPRHASSWVGTPLHHVFSGDEEETAAEATTEDEDDPVPEEYAHTPARCGSKRSSSSRSAGSMRSTADSPTKKKKYKSPALRAMMSGIDRLGSRLEHSRSYIVESIESLAKQREEARLAAVKQLQEDAKQAAAEEQMKEAEKQEELIKLARECGAVETDESWDGLYNMLRDPTAIRFFLKTQTAEGRLRFLKNQATFRPLV